MGWRCLFFAIQPLTNEIEDNSSYYICHDGNKELQGMTHYNTPPLLQNLLKRKALLYDYITFTLKKTEVLEKPPLFCVLWSGNGRQLALIFEVGFQIGVYNSFFWVLC